MVGNIKTDYTNTAALSGSWTLNVEHLEGPGGTVPFLNIGLAMKQGSNFWVAGFNRGDGLPAWTNQQFSGTFTSGSFTPMGGAPTSPDFSAGVQSQFGLITQQNQGGTTYALYFDNWSLDSPALSAVAAVPEARAWLLVGLVATGACVARRFRRTSAFPV